MNNTVDKISEKIGLSYPQPEAEPETAWLFQHSKRDKDGNYLVPIEWEKDGKTVKTYSAPMSQKEFNKLVFRENINILTQRMAPYVAIVDIYKKEVQSVKEKLKGGNLDYDRDAENRNSAVERIKLMWEEYEARFRNKKHTQAAKDYREKILAVMRTVPKKGNIETYHEFQHRKIYYDVDQVAALLAQKKQPAPQVTEWNGDLKPLISFYEKQIDFINDKYIKPVEKKIEANKEWSTK